MNTIAIRFDADAQTGLGHLYRCIAIAQELMLCGTEPIFLTKNTETAIQEIKEQGFKYKLIDETLSEEDAIRKFIESYKPSLLFIDKLYPYSKTFISEIKKKTKTVMFHNSCAGSHIADSFILPSAHSSDELIESCSKSGKLQFYWGADYIVLNPKIEEIKKQRTTNRIIKNKIIITTGGSDPKGIMIQVLKMLNSKNIEPFELVALAGKNFIHKEPLNILKENLQKNITIEEFNFSHYETAEAAIATFGVSTYELMYAGIPVLSVAHALPNSLGSELIQKRYAAIKHIGLLEGISTDVFLKEFFEFARNEPEKQQLAKRGQNLIDGKGAQRIAKILQETAKY